MVYLLQFNQTSREQNDLPHPPLTAVGNEYAWRSADGFGNNVVNPNIGTAGKPYARSVSQTNALPRHQMPDPGLVFDTLLRREKVGVWFQIQLLGDRTNPNLLSQFSSSLTLPVFRP